MFSIEHEFDCTVITILDEGSKQLTEDISVTNFEVRGFRLNKISSVI